MTVAVNDTIERYVIAGAGPYAYTWRIFNDTDLQVYALSTASPPVPTLLTYLTHYTVIGANNAAGGSITLTAAALALYSGYTLDIRGITPRSQPTSIRNQARFLPEIHEDEFDNLSRQVQDIGRLVDAAIRSPDFELPLPMILPPVATRAGKFHAYDLNGQPIASSGTGADAGLRADLANSSSGTDGSRLSTFLGDEAGSAARSVHAKLGDIVDVRDFGAACNGVSNDSAAWVAALASNAKRIRFRGTTLITPGIALRSNIVIEGDGVDSSVILATSNTDSIFTDANLPVQNVRFRDFTFDGGSVGASNRGAFFDSDTANQSRNISFERCHFKNLFRGANLHRVDGLKFYDNSCENLNSAILYVGLSPAGGTSNNIRVRGTRAKDIDTTNDTLGVGILTVHYADDVRIDDTDEENCGKTGDTHHHAIYLRQVTDAVVRDTRAKGRKGGAVVHVFSDLAAGETRSKRVTIDGVIGNGQVDYAAVRCHAVDTLSLANITAENGKTQVCYVSTITGLTWSGGNAKNNNQARASGTDNAVGWLEDVQGAALSNIVGIDNSAGAGQFGQSVLFVIKGACREIHWTNCSNNFGGDVAFGYYGIEIASGATLTRGTVDGFTQIGGSNIFHETGLAIDMTFDNLLLQGVGNTTPFSTTQLHRFAVGRVRVNNAGFPYSSESGFVTARLAAAPTSGTWRDGDLIYKLDFAAATSPGWGCITSGTFSSATDNAGSTDGSTGVITGVADTSDFFVGEYVTVSAGFATTGPFQITAKTASTITVNANSNSVQAGVTVSTPDPTFSAMAALA